MTTPEFVSPDPGDAGDLELAFTLLADALDRLSRDSHARLDQRDDDLAACELLFDIREARQKLAEIEAAVEAVAAQRMTAKKIEWPGFQAERKGGATKPGNWQHDDIAWALVDDLCVGPDGVIDESDRMLVDEVRNRILNAAGISYWRVSIVKQLGVDPYDYCDRVPSRHTVHVTRNVT